ncbi:hypothetical protein GOV05_05405 [Candidatus Woesearchaeota archaeon]|nr:hypothetical protein [Candidatus Woesearchaeota archaeon]
MVSNRTITILTLLIVSLAGLNNLLLLFKAHDITGKAAFGGLDICINQPPTITHNCIITNFSEIDTITCNFFSNEIGTNFYSVFTTNNTVFDITQAGDINKALNYTHAGNHTAIITAIDASGCINGIINTTYVFEVTAFPNHPPIQIRIVENKTWLQDTTLVSYDLDDYFIDIDPGDYITFTNTLTVPNIIITISPSNNRVTYTSQNGFYGKVPIRFIATDTYNASTYSNIVWLEVVRPADPDPPEDDDEPPSSGRITGGAIGGTRISCMPIWDCTPWGDCLPQGYILRDCYDQANCSSNLFKPETTQECDYTPTCFDGYQNGNEEGVDCGGYCDEKCPKPTCFDGIRNQGERGVDCEGPCENKCVEESCYDGLRNQDEEGIDCGGSCQTKCAIEEQPRVISLEWLRSLSIILLLIALLTSLTYYAYKNKDKLKPLLIKKKKKKRPVITLKENTDFMKKLGELEQQLYYLESHNSLRKLSKITINYLQKLLDFVSSFTNDEIIRIITSSTLPAELQEIIIDFFNEVNQEQYQDKEVSKNKILTMIYEAKNIVSLTTKKTKKKKKKEQEYYSFLVEIKKEGRIEEIYAKIAEINLKILNKNLVLAKRLYLDLYKQTKKEKIKSLKYSIKNTHNLISYLSEYETPKTK